MATDSERNRGAGAYSGAGVETLKPETGPSAIITQKPILAFKTTGADPPSPFWVTEVDQLVVTVWNSLAAADLTLTWRLLDIYSGELKQNVQDMFPTSDKVQNNFRFNLAQGFLLSVQLGFRGAAAKRGQTFAFVSLQRVSGTSGFGTATLFADYISEQASLGWPGAQQRANTEGPGFIHSQLTTNPAAGAEMIVTVPASTRWGIISDIFALQTSATVANRNVEFLIDDGVNSYWRVTAPVTVPASTLQIFSVAAFNYPQGIVATDSVLPMPANLRLIAGHRLRTLTTNLQAGDQYSGLVTLVEEWLDF